MPKHSALVLLLVGCGSTSPDDGGLDAESDANRDVGGDADSSSDASVERDADADASQDDSGSTDSGAPDSGPADPICTNQTEDDELLTFTVLPIRSAPVVIRDQERSAARSSNQYVRHTVQHFFRVEDGTFGYATDEELMLNDSDYVPYLSEATFDTFERRAVASRGAFETGAYREIFIYDAGRLAFYNSLNSQGGELSGLSDAEACAGGGAGAAFCDHVVIAGQVWGWNLSGAALGSASHAWVNHMTVSASGGYYYNMNTPTERGFTQRFEEHSTVAQMSYLPGFTATDLGNLAFHFNRAYADGPWPHAGHTVTLDLENAWLVEHFSGCSSVEGDPMMNCTVWEAHVYGQSSASSPCGKRLGLGVVAIFIGETPLATGGSLRVRQGYVVSGSDVD